MRRPRGGTVLRDRRRGHRGPTHPTDRSRRGLGLGMSAVSGRSGRRGRSRNRPPGLRTHLRRGRVRCAILLGPRPGCGDRHAGSGLGRHLVAECPSPPDEESGFLGPAPPAVRLPRITAAFACSGGPRRGLGLGWPRVGQHGNALCGLCARIGWDRLGKPSKPTSESTVRSRPPR